MKPIISKSEQDTKTLAAKIAKESKIPTFICLFGDLGAGKTVFVKGFAQGLGLKENDIKSPTYTFVREYKLGKNNLYHFDFYRVEEIDDLMHHDLQEIFERKNTIILVEWAERIAKIVPKKRTEIKIDYIDDHTRKLTINDRN